MTSLSSYVSEKGFMWREIITAKAWSQPPTPQWLERHTVSLSLLRPGVKHTWREDKFNLPALCSSGVGWLVRAQGLPASRHPTSKCSMQQGAEGHSLVHLLAHVSPGTVWILCAPSTSRQWLRWRANWFGKNLATISTFFRGFCCFLAEYIVEQMIPSTEETEFSWIHMSGNSNL